MDDAVTSPQGKHDSPAPPKRGRWLKRFLVAVLLLVVICVGVFSWFAYRIRSNPPYSTALELIRNDAQIIEHLGQPIANVRWLPSGNYPTQFQIQVKGPRRMADVSVSAREFQGKWEVSALNARAYDPNKPHETAVSISLDIGSSPDDAPVWNPGGAATESGKSDDLGLEPPAGINLEAPGGPPGIKIELPPMPEMPPAPES